MDVNIENMYRRESSVWSPKTFTLTTAPVRYCNDVSGLCSNQEPSDNASTASETEIWDALDDEGIMIVKERPAQTLWTKLFTVLIIFDLVRNLALTLKINSLVISKSTYRLKSYGIQSHLSLCCLHIGKKNGKHFVTKHCK